MISWPWSTETSAAIQALASIAVLAVTGALAWFTRTYVKYTQALVDVSKAQVELAKTQSDIAELQRQRERLSAVNGFVSLIAKLKHLLDGVAGNDGKVYDRLIRTASVWTRGDVEELERQGARVFADAPHPLLVLATESLSGLLDQAERVRATSESMGFRYTEHFTSQWEQRVQGAQHALTELAASADVTRTAV